MTEGVPSQLVHTGQVVNELPRLLPQLFWRGCQSAAVSLAGEGLDSSRRSARMVPMVLPLLYGPANARRGCAADQALERYAPPRGPDQTPLRTRWSDLPQAAEAGPPPLGLWQPKDL